MSSASVTFIIATYKRADALKCTLRSLIMQRHENWTALVLGDCCDEQTAEAISSLNDPRIRYYNFPQRYGEQSGPNSFGLHLAEGDYVSFLNHDDLLLADHLSYSLEQMQIQNSDFHIAKHARANKLEVREDGTSIPLFTALLPRQQNLDLMMFATHWIFEPSSFWLIRTSYAKSVGWWQPSGQLWRTSLRDWLMRAWRKGGKITFGDKFTGLGILTHYRRPGQMYQNTSPEHEYLIELLRTNSPDVIRRVIEQQIENDSSDKPWKKASDRDPMVRLTDLKWARSAATIWVRFPALLYLWFGIDLLNFRSWLFRKPKGRIQKDLLQRRTGESMRQTVNIAELLKNPEAYRVL